MRGSGSPSTEAIDGRINDKQSMSRLGTTCVDDSSRVDEEDGNSHSFWRQLLSSFTPNSMFLKDYIIGAKNLIYRETDPNAWPPPTLLLLAALTLFALLVHPDGFTWILVGKLRDVMTSTYLAAIWASEVVVHDYGVIPTIAASTTLGTLMFLIFVMLKTLSPRTPKQLPTLPEKKKKKRKKGNSRQRGGGVGRARIKSSASLPRNATSLNSTDQTPYLEAIDDDSENEVPSSIDDNDKSTTSKLKNRVPALPTAPDFVNEKLIVKRDRIASVSTLDSMTLSIDEQWCGSISVQSIAYETTTSSKGIGAVDAETTQTEKERSSPVRSNNLRPKGAGEKFSQQRNIHNSHHAGVKAPSSRWDALKPNYNHNQNQPQQNQRKASHQNTVKRRTFDRGQRRGRQQYTYSSSNFPTSFSAQDREPLLTALKPTTSKSLTQSSVQSTKSIVERNVPETIPPIPPPGLGPPPLSISEAKPRNASWAHNSFAAEISGWQGTRRVPQFPSPPRSESVYFGQQFDTTRPTQFSTNRNPSNSQGSSSTVKDNPFASDTVSDSQIEADLQELGGQMAGSILDF